MANDAFPSTVFQEIIASLRPGTLPEATRTPCSPVVLSALRMIEEQLGKDPVRLRLVAERLAVSEWQLSRAFRRQLGVSFRQCVRVLRIRIAESLLARVDLCIKEVAVSAGYRHTSDLDHEFKRFHGVSPSEYRRGWSGVFKAPGSAG